MKNVHHHVLRLLKTYPLYSLSVNLSYSLVHSITLSRSLDLSISLFRPIRSILESNEEEEESVSVCVCVCVCV